MRILDTEQDRSVNDATLFLTVSEASELRDKLVGMLERPVAGNHEHIPSADFERELCVCLYDESDLRGLNDRSVRLIREGK